MKLRFLNYVFQYCRLLSEGRFQFSITNQVFKLSPELTRINHARDVVINSVCSLADVIRQLKSHNIDFCLLYYFLFNPIDC